jgi:diguanylate cyclase (GGDEF)-like protein/PAS domain S-box-containing protein
LEGLAAGWSEPAPYPEVFYARLPPGDYRASARVSADGHTWVEVAEPFRFSVLAPFWRRGWFIALALALISLAVYGGHRLAVARLKAHQRELTDEVAVRQRAEQAMRESERTLRGLLDATSDTVLLLDAAGTILALNDRAAHALAGPASDLLGRNVFERLPLALARPRRERLQQAVESGRRVRFEDQHGGNWFEHILTPLVDSGGVVSRVAVFSRDVTSQKEAEARLQHDAFHDPLTGLANRALLVERLEWAIRRTTRHPDRHFAVLFLDLDRFKQVNDSLGHEAGNQLLRSIAPRLQACLRASDTCARLGGDEFAVLLDEAQGAGDAAEVAQRILRRLWEPFVIEGRQLTVSASIGIVTSHTGYASAVDVLRDVDIAMYRAKELGRSRYEVFSVEMRTEVLAQLDLQEALERAAERGELRVFYQPIVALATGCVEGFEALVRWQHPERGLLQPREFIAIAESGRLIGAIDAFVLRQACRQLLEWHRRVPAARGLTINVNTSGRLFGDGELAVQVGRVLEETGLAPRLLQLEITESALMQSMSTAQETLRQLRGLGVRVAVDDFGVGYSSLAYLVQLPVDTLKIDRTFVSHLTGPHGQQQIVETIVALGQKLGTRLIAEGIETPEQRALLVAMGCPSGQGYLFSEPLEPDAVTSLLTRNTTSPDGPAARLAVCREAN